MYTLAGVQCSASIFQSVDESSVTSAFHFIVKLWKVERAEIDLVDDDV